MAVNIPAPQASSRLQMEDELMDFRTHMDKVLPNVRVAKVNNNFIKNELKKLQALTYTRLTSRTDAALLAKAKLD